MTALAVVQFAAMIAALTCFVLAALNVPVKWNLIATGLALWLFATVIARWPG